MKKILAMLLLFATISGATVYTLTGLSTGCKIYYNTFNNEFAYTDECNMRPEMRRPRITCPVMNLKDSPKNVKYVNVFPNDDGNSGFEAILENGSYAKYDANRFTDDLRNDKIIVCYELHTMEVSH